MKKRNYKTFDQTHLLGTQTAKTWILTRGFRAPAPREKEKQLSAKTTAKPFPMSKTFLKVKKNTHRKQISPSVNKISQENKCHVAISHESIRRSVQMEKLTTTKSTNIKTILLHSSPA
jgi:hypothetical protein